MYSLQISIAHLRIEMSYTFLTECCKFAEVKIVNAWANLFLLQWYLLEMYRVLLDIAAVDNCTLQFQRLNLGSAGTRPVKNLERFAINTSFGSSELVCHMLSIFKQYIWMVITILHICTRFRLGPTPDLYNADI